MTATKAQPPKPQKPPVPTLFTIVAVLVAVALIGGSYLVGRSIGTPPPPPPSPSPTPPPTVPEQLAGYTLSEETEPSAAPGTDTYVTRGNYTDGTNKLVLLLTRPAKGIEKFMTDGGVTDLQEVVDPSPSPSPSPSEPEESPTGSPSPEPEPMMCGKAADTGLAACGRIVDNTGQLLYAATELPPEQLQELLEQVQP